MEPPIRDLGKRGRLLRAFIVSMVVAVLTGLLCLLGWATQIGTRTSGPPYEALVHTSTASFWAVFLILYFTTVRKSAATLEYQERLRRDRDADPSDSQNP